MPLAKKDLPSHKTMVNNILAVMGAATCEDLMEGRRWYEDAYTLAAYLAAGTPYSAWQTAGVIAVISPRLGWRMNTLYPQLIIDYHARGRRRVESWAPMNVTMDCRRKALLVLDGDLTPVMNGLKVESFFKAILGDREAVAVDSWAARAAVANPEPDGVSRFAYPYVSRAYRDAAGRFGENPREAQAITWCAYKRLVRTGGIIYNDSRALA